MSGECWKTRRIRTRSLFLLSRVILSWWWTSPITRRKSSQCSKTGGLASQLQTNDRTSLQKLHWTYCGNWKTLRTLATFLRRSTKNFKFLIQTLHLFMAFQKFIGWSLVSLVVVSLFTSIPVRLANDVLKTKLQQSDGWKGTATLTEVHVRDLLEFVLGNSYFSLIRGCTTSKYLVVQWGHQSAQWSWILSWPT